MCEIITHIYMRNRILYVGSLLTAQTFLCHLGVWKCSIAYDQATLDSSLMPAACSKKIH